MRFSTVLDRLAVAMQRPLPGAAAQGLMAPRMRRSWPPGWRSEDAREAAGLLLLVPMDSQALIVLTERAQGLDRHGGQVSMPGGRLEPGETYEEAALREAHEEIGLDPRVVRTLGALTPVDIAVSGFRLYPVVGVADSFPALEPAAHEVSRILTVPVSGLLDSDRVVWRSVAREGRRVDFPAFPFEGTEVWGATAMVLAEFLSLLGWVGPPDHETPPVP